MKLRTYSSEGIILAKKNYSEADRVLTLLTKNKGKLTVLAKGVRRMKSRKRGHIEVFNRIKFSAVEGKGMDIITEAETLEDYKDIRISLNKVTLAYYFAEVIFKILREDENHEEVFRLLVKTFGELETSKDLKSLRLNFIKELLVLLGYYPQNKDVADPDAMLEEVLERKVNSYNIGKKILQ